MLEKTDVILLLTELQQEGINVDKELKLILSGPYISVDVLKKINSERSLDIVNFYKKLKKSYNEKRSKLYINIMKSDENILDNPKTILTTLSAMLNQVLQYRAQDVTQFYKHVRADEISKVLVHYFNSYDLEPARKLLALIKADIKVFESSSN